MPTLHVQIRKAENGYYVTIFYGFWNAEEKRFIAATKLEIGNIINDNWKIATKEEQIKDQIL